MKILVIGSTGTIGAAVARAFSHSKNHEVVGVSRKSTPAIDIEDHATIAPFFKSIGPIDAVVCCAGSGAFGKQVGDLTDADFEYSVRSKLLGQAKVIRAAFLAVKDGGSITVTTGILAQNPMPGTAAVAMINAGLEGFVRGAALDAPRGIRVNAVSPPWITETLIAFKMDPSWGIPAAEAAKAYVTAVDGKMTGQVLSCK